MPQDSVRPKIISITTFFLCCLTSVVMSQSEDARLLSVEEIVDLSKTPIYSRLIDPASQEEKWKEEYQYLDRVKLSRISYLSDGLIVTGFMAVPKEAGTYPCIIFNRGGNRDFGQLKVAHAAMMFGKMADRGYVVIASNYRGNGGSEGQEEFGGSDVSDVLNLLRVLEDVPEADTSRIGMMGWSRGGMMTYLALKKTDRIKAAVVGGGAADLTTEDRPEMEKSVYAELIPGYDKNRDSVLQQRSAVYWPESLSKSTALLILHGNADWRVKCEQSLRLAMALDKIRYPYRLVIYEGADHGISEFRDEVFEESLNWFHKYLKEGQALPNMKYHGK